MKKGLTLEVLTLQVSDLALGLASSFFLGAQDAFLSRILFHPRVIAFLISKELGREIFL